VLAALDEASGALRPVEERSLSLTPAPGFSLTAAARQYLTDVGVTLEPSGLGGIRAQLNADRLSTGGWRRLLAILAEELPGFDRWDPWSAEPAPGAERCQALLDVVSGLCSVTTSVPEPARTVLMDADRHLFPQWWRARDDLTRAGVPDIAADQSFPDFLEAYLGWCLTIIDRVGASAGGYPYDMGFAIPRSEAVTLPTGRFGLEMRPARPETEIRLYGKFRSLVGFSAWVFLELADQVRATAAQPSPYTVPPPETLA